MTRVLILIAAVALAGCATQVQTIGPYANQLSHTDVQQITALIVESDFYTHGTATLEALRPQGLHGAGPGQRRPDDDHPARSHGRRVDAPSPTAARRPGAGA